MAFAVGPNRYLVGPMEGERVVAYDQVDRAKLIFFKKAAADGVHMLARSGGITVRRGKLVGIVPPAKSSGYDIVASRRGEIRFDKFNSPRWSLTVSGGRAAPSNKFALLDLRNGSLMFVAGDGVWSLTLDSTTRGDTADEPGNPTYDLMIDLAP